MPCVFCNSFFHLSNDCHVDNINDFKNNYLHNRQTYELFEDHLSRNPVFRVPKIMCFFCYSESHYTVDCQNKDSNDIPFFPAIDIDLHSRFLKTWNLLESITHACTSPKASNSSTVIPLRIFKATESPPFAKIIISDSNVVIADTFKMYKFHYIEPFNSAFANLINTNKFMLIAKAIRLKGVEISAPTFLALLSKATKTISCDKIRILPPTITISDILEKSPSIEIVEISCVGDENGNAMTINYKKLMSNC